MHIKGSTSRVAYTIRPTRMIRIAIPHGTHTPSNVSMSMMSIDGMKATNAIYVGAWRGSQWQPTRKTPLGNSSRLEPVRKFGLCTSTAFRGMLF